MQDKILIVDDDADLRSELRDCLEGYDIVEAGGGKKALDILKRANEFCMWITAESLNAEEIKQAMKKAKPDFDKHLNKSHIEVIPYAKCYLKGGAFNQKMVFKGWHSCV